MCDICGKEYSNATWLEKHKQNKHPVLRPQVPLSDHVEHHSDDQQSELEQSVEQDDQDEPNNQVDCKICGKFFRKKGLATHMSRIHKRAAVNTSDLPPVNSSGGEGDVNGTSPGQLT